MQLTPEEIAEQQKKEEKQRKVLRTGKE